MKYDFSSNLGSDETCAGRLETVPAVHVDHCAHLAQHHHDGCLLLHLQKASQSDGHRAKSQQVQTNFIKENKSGEQKNNINGSNNVGGP